MNPEVQIDANYVIQELRNQLSDAHWQLVVLKAQLASLNAAMEDSDEIAESIAD